MLSDEISQVAWSGTTLRLTSDFTRPLYIMLATCAVLASGPWAGSRKALLASEIPTLGKRRTCVDARVGVPLVVVGVVVVPPHATSNVQSKRNSSVFGERRKDVDTL